MGEAAYRRIVSAGNGATSAGMVNRGHGINEVRSVNGEYGQVADTSSDLARTSTGWYTRCGKSQKLNCTAGQCERRVGLELVLQSLQLLLI